MDEVLRVNKLNSADLEQERWKWGKRWSEVGLGRGRWGLREVKRGFRKVKGVGRDKKRFKRGGGGAWRR